MVATFGQALLVITAICVAAWLLSLRLNDVSIVDSLWSLFFLAAAIVYAASVEAPGFHGMLVLTLTAIWALRLSIYITWRNHGEPEDHRYQKIRANNEPNFRIKSFYIVFLLQGVLALVISSPLYAAITGEPPSVPVAVLATLLWLTGFFFEAVGDWQLNRFRERRDSRGDVLRIRALAIRGIRTISVKPALMTFWLFAAGSGGWWTIYAPLLMTFLLLKVSGVAMLEKTISDRRPAYADYIRRTSAFIPWPPKKAAAEGVDS
ncbi:MAG: DUF1295 domain-containing protein [Woeseiaceae bacterium]|nr:DUF1295 domain-containing protein [Woeseiaceae bacterium]